MSLAVDTLHTLFSGPCMRLVSTILWRLLFSNPWGFRGSQQLQLELGCRRLRDDMRVYFQEFEIPAGDRLGDLTLPMLGPPNPNGCTMKAKAAETAKLLPWALLALDKYGQDVAYAAELRVAGDSLARYCELLNAHGLLIPPPVQQELMSCCQRHLCNIDRAGVHLVPKHHFWMHMTHRPPGKQTNFARVLCNMPNISVYMMVCVRQLITSQDPGARESTVLLNILGRKPQPDVANCVLRCSSPVHGGTRVQAFPAPGRIGVHPVCFRMSGVPPAVRDRAAELAPDGRLIAGGRGPFLLGLAAREVMRQAPGIERRHEFMEVFAGAAGCSQAVRHDGLQAATFDREGPHGHESEDITQLSGLIWAGMLICSVTENGLC